MEVPHCGWFISWKIPIEHGSDDWYRYDLGNLWGYWIQHDSAKNITWWFQLPIGSMYAIYGNIYHQQKPQMLAYVPYMDPMG